MATGGSPQLGGVTKGYGGISYLPAPDALGRSGGALEGELFSAVAIDSEERRLQFRCRQKLYLGETTTAKVFGLFQSGADPRWRFQLSKKVTFPAMGTKISTRLRYDPRKSQVKSRVYAKKKLGMTDHLDLNLKFELVGTHTELDLPKAPDFQARSKCELSMKVLDATDTQDLRVRAGVQLEDLTSYVEVRENHAQIKWNSTGQWSLLYDL